MRLAPGMYVPPTSMQVATSSPDMQRSVVNPESRDPPVTSGTTTNGKNPGQQGPFMPFTQQVSREPACTQSSAVCTRTHMHKHNNATHTPADIVSRTRGRALAQLYTALASCLITVRCLLFTQSTLHLLKRNITYASCTSSTLHGSVYKRKFTCIISHLVFLCTILVYNKVGNTRSCVGAFTKMQNMNG